MTEDLLRTFNGSIPEYYDKCLGPAWYDRYAADLARRLPADPGGDVLEIACGTGRLTRHVRKRLDAHRRLVATDLNAPMLEYARQSADDGNGIEWRQADATRLPFADGEFAALVCSFGVMFPPDREALFREARRVLRPGGRFLFNVWDRIEENTSMHVYSQVIQQMFPGDKEIDFRLPYEMYDESLLRGLLRDAGFAGATFDKVPVAVEGVPALQVAEGQVRGTPRGLLLAKRGVDLGTMIGRVAAALEAAGGTGREFRARCQAIVVEATASRPVDSPAPHSTGG